MRTIGFDFGQPSCDADAIPTAASTLNLEGRSQTIPLRLRIVRYGSPPVSQFFPDPRLIMHAAGPDAAAGVLQHRPQARVGRQSRVRREVRARRALREDFRTPR